jgi:hypothetical protein
MATIIRLSCDKCQGDNLTSVMGSVSDARRDGHSDGWRHHTDSVSGDIDLCPVCTGIDSNYWVAEPF